MECREWEKVWGKMEKGRSGEGLECRYCDVVGSRFRFLGKVSIDIEEKGLGVRFIKLGEFLFWRFYWFINWVVED